MEEEFRIQNPESKITPKIMMKSKRQRVSSHSRQGTSSEHQVAELKERAKNANSKALLAGHKHFAHFAFTDPEERTQMRVTIKDKTPNTEAEILESGHDLIPQLYINTDSLSPADLSTMVKLWHHCQQLQNLSLPPRHFQLSKRNFGHHSHVQSR